MPAKTYRVHVAYQSMQTMSERIWEGDYRGWDDAEAEFNNICDDLIIVSRGDSAIIRLEDRKGITHKYQVK